MTNVGGRWATLPRGSVVHWVPYDYHTSMCGFGTAWSDEWIDWSGSDPATRDKRQCERCRKSFSVAARHAEVAAALAELREVS